MRQIKIPFIINKCDIKDILSGKKDLVYLRSSFSWGSSEQGFNYWSHKTGLSSADVNYLKLLIIAAYKTNKVFISQKAEKLLLPEPKNGHV